MAKKKPAKSKSDAPDQPSFEDSLGLLHDVVEQLEDGQLSLSDSLTQYEQGVKHLKNCHAALKGAQRKIELLVKIDKDGNLVTQDFDDSATEELAGGASRPSASKRSAGTGSPKSGKTKRSAQEQELVDELDQETDPNGDSSSLF